MPFEPRKVLNCAVYTRKSTEEGLEQQFNSLDAQREACEAFILSQKHEGWKVIETPYDDGGFSGGNMDRPALKQLLADIQARKVDVVVVYKVDRLTRSLSDFAKIVETFDAQGVSFVSVTQQFNTTTSMGRLTLNVLLSFAQFEREVSAERVRDKIAASRKKGMWMGGTIALGYDIKDKRYVIHPDEAQVVRTIFSLYLELGCVRALQTELKRRGLKTKVRVYESGKRTGGVWFSRGHLYYLLNNRSYLGEAVHKGKSYPGAHEPIIALEQWTQVQERLKSNKVDLVMGRSAKDPSLLGGLIFDDRGNRLTASHSVKRGARYRYYVSQPLLQNQSDKAGPIKRLPAGDIEALVRAQVQKLIDNPKRLIAELLSPSADGSQKQAVVTRAASLVSAMRTKSRSEIHALLRSIISKVVVGPERVQVRLNPTELRRALNLLVINPDDSDRTEPHIEMSVDARLKRSGRETKLLIGEFEYEPKQRKPNAGMIETLKKAHACNAAFLAGRSTADIAAEMKLHRKYVAAVIPLAFLAPDITTAILEGRQPRTLTTKKMLRHVPFDWAEQRRVFGFSAI